MINRRKKNGSERGQKSKSAQNLRGNEGITLVKFGFEWIGLF